MSAVDALDVRRARRATGLVAEFNDAGVLAAADVHVARRLAELAGEENATVELAVALAVRAPRLGHVHVDLATISDTATVESDEPIDLTGLPWPEASGWVAEVAASSGLVAVGEDEAAASAPLPLRLVGSWLYLDRYWREERQVAADLEALASSRPGDVLLDSLHEGLARLFEGETDGRQRLAAACAVLNRLAVVAGGPGTGKTTTVARIVALLCEQAAGAGADAPLVALAAPTGKAAARLEEAVHAEAVRLPVGDEIREQLLALEASTLHRLLGRRPGSESRFRHHRGQRLPHDVVIVDETSMVSLWMMARLLEAIRPDARLVLVGDPGQLASIEAGAVLGDIVGPASEGLRIGAAGRAQLEEATGHAVEAEAGASDASGVGDGIVVLDRGHRFGEAIAQLAEAIRRGDADAVLSALADGGDEVEWIALEAGDDADADAGLTAVRDGALAAARHVVEAARVGEGREALEALGSFRVLCAHRRGPQGVAFWTARIEGWLAGEVGELGGGDGDRWYAGRPLLVTENDYGLGLYNGDTGVVVQAADPDRLVAAFERRVEVVEFSPTRLGAVDTVYAMTIHKSQGSQFETAAVLLPGPASRILTRELLYTAATRARRRLVLAGTEEAIRAAVERPVARASGLGWRLWEEGVDTGGWRQTTGRRVARLSESRLRA